MGIQYTLDRTKSIAEIIGETHNKARYYQNGIEFDAAGDRVSKLTSEEVVAQRAEEAAAEVVREAEEAKAAAEMAVSEADARAAAKADAYKPAPEPNPEMPDFTNWVKADMINIAFNKFGVKVSANKTWQAIRDQVEGLF